MSEARCDHGWPTFGPTPCPECAARADRALKRIEANGGISTRRLRRRRVAEVRQAAKVLAARPRGGAA